MKLSWALQPEFPSLVRARGATYFSRRAVRFQQGSARRVQARVQGSRSYSVEIDKEPRKVVTFSCDCQYFTDVGPCKHLWATILAAEAFGHLSAITAEDEVMADGFANGELKYDPFKGLDPQGAGAEGELTGLPSFELTPPPSHHPARAVSRWRQRLGEIAQSPELPGTDPWPPQRQLVYVIDIPSSMKLGQIVLTLMAREPKHAGGWKKETSVRLTRGMVARMPDPLDARVAALLSGSSAHNTWMVADLYGTLPSSYRLSHPLSVQIIQQVAGSGRCLLQLDSVGRDLRAVTWDEGPPWQFRLRISAPDREMCTLTGFLKRGEREIGLRAARLILPGLLFLDDQVAALEESTPLDWLSSLRRSGSIEAPAGEAAELIGALLEHPTALPPLDLPDEMTYQEVQVAPRPCLLVTSGSNPRYRQEHMRAKLCFEYHGKRVPESLKGRGFFEHANRRFILRDAEVEKAASELLRELGLTGPAPEWPDREPAWNLSAKRLPSVARACLDAGWHIEVEGKTFRSPGATRVSVSSGVDWFELEGEVDFGESSANLPELLAALRRGDNMVRLGDGSYGLLPEEWLGRFASLAKLGTFDDGSLRFRRNQAGLLDALLAAQPEVRCDETFTRVRRELNSFEGVASAAQPEGFVGQLRDYQRDGVGWMAFLRRFQFGGCLADDMGVGKTAQVLAMLEHRRAEAQPGPSLVVAPKSLVFNWVQEAARFTPQLRVLDYTGIGRDAKDFAEHDVVITTYGTLRRDATIFKDLEFDYLVLDEAQSIKNANTESAKAARLLRGRNRLALSGTPVENHLGELWSLFEFLNPGMLGTAGVFKLGGGAGKTPDSDTRDVLRRALRPFILRRTKEQVARELPAKSEQTIFCELEPPQRKLYNELRVHYRRSLLKTVDSKGLAKSKIQVLEALLRLRQAACHPGLLDVERKSEPSAKMEVLIGRLSELVEEGHKALVFSQFTSLLAIVRERLDLLGLEYEYLDGATNKRQEHVENFQNNPDCRLFLISLKAGGLGLNLTAADYVFLLDPWWNPAVEAQAVDRAHRIGQTRKVFTYRLIARDTVEEKVMQLQNSKRDLVNAIIGEDNSLIRSLQREDLELLLS